MFLSAVFSAPIVSYLSKELLESYLQTCHGLKKDNTGLLILLLLANEGSMLILGIHELSHTSPDDYWKIWFKLLPPPSLNSVPALQARRLLLHSSVFGVLFQAITWSFG